MKRKIGLSRIWTATIDILIITLLLSPRALSFCQQSIISTVVFELDTTTVETPPPTGTDTHTMSQSEGTKQWLGVKMHLRSD